MNRRYAPDRTNGCGYTKYEGMWIWEYICMHEGMYNKYQMK